MKDSVLLDTSFFIRLLDDEDPLHENAKAYFKHFLENDTTLKISTISIAEYCVRGAVDELPLRNLQIVPFNLDHAQQTGRFAEVIFAENNIREDKLKPRAIIPNDAKLFAQADIDNSVTYFITSDSRLKATWAMLKKHLPVRFGIIDIENPYGETFGRLDL